MKSHTIGIVGGSGYIGSSLAQDLSKSYEVRVLDVNPPPSFIKEEVEFIKCDVRRYDDLAAGLRDTSLVVYTAIVQIPMINEEKRLGYEVNILGLQNACEIVRRTPAIKGLVLSGSWHVIGERGLRGVVNEEFGFRPDKVEERAKIYALCKVAQETIVRLYDETYDKVYGVVRMGTVLGEGMPEKTAANIFISRGLKGEKITPYSHSAHRPMLYTDIGDICRAYEAYSRKILDEQEPKESKASHVVNLYWPEPTTILDLATLVKDAVMKLSDGRIRPEISITQTEFPAMFTPEDKELISIDVRKARSFLGLEQLTSPRESIERIVEARLSEQG